MLNFEKVYGGQMNEKRFLNDFRSAIIFAICGVGFVFAMLLCLINVDQSETSSVVIIGSLFGVSLMMCIIGLLYTFELIVFYNDKIISFTIKRRIEIYYSEIVSVQMIEKAGKGECGIADVWEIKDNNDNTIDIIRSKNRARLLMQINEIREKITYN